MPSSADRPNAGPQIVTRRPPAPSGSRRGVLAKWALGLVFFDHRRKRIGVEVFLQLSGDRAADLRTIAAACDRAAGRHPQLAGPIVFKG